MWTSFFWSLSFLKYENLFIDITEPLIRLALSPHMVVCRRCWKSARYSIDHLKLLLMCVCVCMCVYVCVCVTCVWERERERVRVRVRGYVCLCVYLCACACVCLTFENVYQLPSAYPPSPSSLCRRVWLSLPFTGVCVCPCLCVWESLFVCVFACVTVGGYDSLLPAQTCVWVCFCVCVCERELCVRARVSLCGGYDSLLPLQLCERECVCVCVCVRVRVCVRERERVYVSVRENARVNECTFSSLRRCACVGHFPQKCSKISGSFRGKWPVTCVNECSLSFLRRCACVHSLVHSQLCVCVWERELTAHLNEYTGRIPWLISHESLELQGGQDP